jgi:hypothetical protein
VNIHFTATGTWNNPTIISVDTIEQNVFHGQIVSNNSRQAKIKLFTDSGEFIGLKYNFNRIDLRALEIGSWITVWAHLKDSKNTNPNIEVFYVDRIAFD